MLLKDYLKILRKRGWIILLVALVAVGSAYVFSKLQTPVYRSAIKLNVEPTRADYGQTLVIKGILRQYADNIRTRKMAQKVVDQLQLDISPETLLGKLAVDPTEDNLTLTIEAKMEASDVRYDQTRRVVVKFAELFVEERQLKNLEVDQRDRVVTSIADDPTGPNLFSPRASINMLAGGVLGALLGLVILFALEWFESDIVRSGDDVERFTGLPVIGSIPTITPRQTQPSSTPTREGVPSPAA